MAAEGVYVYAIVRAAVAPPSDVGGVGSPPAPLRSIRRGKVAAVVSEAPPKLRARRRDLLAHQDLLQRLAEDGPVLPMRFGVVAPDEESVRRQLARAEGEHVAALERLSGGVEVNMKAFPAQSGLSSLIAEDRNVRHLRDEARRRPGYEASLRLGEAVAAALAARAAAAGRRILRELTPLAREVATGPDVQGCTLNVSFLVDRREQERFRARAQRFADAHRDHVELRLAGPLPCYSFVTAESCPSQTAAGV
ncbi:GvpL/GvpF family gas vesicle protein [Streptomyces longhuiensis]|uniref:GvpL/GvpF family gas vesicle protein n=1 Tax=Streptomyces TaxID=1883 RepID=UPI001D0A636E|nr:GvpL/GvpF family gas vesicle protein [Streptomyces longhuiensis]UDL97233.1 GvpL/GvpF family gas vesicle protein [Streptomyces longhuiensis]